jgi:hypothetical protein
MKMMQVAALNSICNLRLRLLHRAVQAQQAGMDAIAFKAPQISGVEAVDEQCA